MLDDKRSSATNQLGAVHSSMSLYYSNDIITADKWRMGFMKQLYKYKKLFLVLLMGMLIFSLAGCSKNVEKVDKNHSKVAGYPIVSEVSTTLQKTVVPDAIPAGSEKVLPYEIAKYKQNGYGNWHYGPGVASEKRLDLMPTTYRAASATNAAKLLNFFAITDIHITDEARGSKG